MNYQLLRDDIIGVLARQIHYFDGFDRISSLKASSEVIESVQGGVDRFMSDPYFRARVESITFGLMLVIREHVEAETKKPPVKEADL